MGREWVWIMQWDGVAVGQWGGSGVRIGQWMGMGLDHGIGWGWDQVMEWG